MKKRILVVDDSRTQLERLRILLVRSEYEVETASTGEEGVERVKRSPPDMIISDVVMPGMDGFAFCEAVRANPGTRRVPFILLTEWTTPKDIIRGLSAGADNFIPKPYDEQQLLARVERIFRQLELRRQGQLGVEVLMQVGDREFVVTADKQQIVELLFSTFEELSRVNTELEHAAAEAERANLAKSEFLSRMSHELRTPLNAILGFGQLLEMDSLSSEHREGVELILKAGRHLLDLINEVLDISRIEAGRMSLSPEPIHIGDMLNEVKDLVRPLADRRSIRMEEPANGALNRHVRADRQSLRQVLLNLLANAVKYNRDAGTVTISSDDSAGSALRIMVSDTGAGIPRGKMDRLFTPFDRLGAEQTQEEGTGLGLALSKGLVEAMGGTIGVESAIGEGSTFWVELPIVEGQAAMGEETETAEDSPAVRSQGPFTVLYLEDNPSNATLVERILSQWGDVKLATVMKGREGFDMARADRPDLILLDLGLPDITGEEVMRMLRQDLQTRAIPVVVITADATQRQVKRMIDLGVKEYLTKPLDVERFAEVVRATLPIRTP